MIIKDSMCVCMYVCAQKQRTHTHTGLIGILGGFNRYFSIRKLGLIGVLVYN
jgi:hypothetical protein